MASILSAAYSQNMSGVFVTPLIPVGSLSTSSNIGIGIGGQSRFFPIERLAVGFNATFHYYFGKNGFNGFIMVPIRGNVEYWFTDEGAIFRPYTGLDLGLYITTYSNTVGAKFGMAPGAGISFELSDYISLQIQARYNFVFDTQVLMAVEPSVGFTYTFY